MRNATLPTVLVAVTLGGAVGTPVASGQTTQPDEPVATVSPPAPSREAIFAGPSVEPEAERERVAFGRRRGGGQDRVTVPARRWFEVARSLDLSDEQRRQIREAAARFQTARRAFLRTTGDHDDETGALRRTVQRPRETGEPLPEGVRETMAGRRGDAPRIVTCQREVWALLTPPQQRRMKTELERIREEMRRRRDA